MRAVSDVTPKGGTENISAKCVRSIWGCEEGCVYHLSYIDYNAIFIKRLDYLPHLWVRLD